MSNPNVRVLGPARTPAQMVHQLEHLSRHGALAQLVIVARDPDGHLGVYWDDSVDTPTLCEIATYLRLESERAVADEQNDPLGVEGTDSVEDDPSGGGAS